MIKPQQWNRVFVTISKLEDQNDMEIVVFISSVIPYSATSQTWNIVRYSNIYSVQYELKSSTIKIAFYNSKTSTSPESNVWMDLSSAGNPSCPAGYIQQLYFCMDSCGDGNLQLNPQIYQWDDGNTKDGDGCSHSWMIESGYTCTTTSIRNLRRDMEGSHRRLSTINRSDWVRTCGNGVINAVNNEACDDGNANDGDGWSSSWTIESGYKWKTNVSPTFWYPNWGDGIKDTTPIVEEWDDGNNFSNDGWSSNCKIETNYQWTQGSNGVDVCTTKYSSPTIIKNSLIDSESMSVILYFDQEMKNQNLSTNDLEITINGPNSPYSVSWSSTFDSSNLKISLQISPNLIGGVDETIYVQLLDINSFKSMNQIPLQSAQSFSYNVENANTNTYLSQSSSGISYAFIITFLISLGIMILTGDSMELMWSLTNTLQLIFYFGQMNLYFSSNLNEVFYFMRYSNFENPLTDYLKNMLMGLWSSFGVSFRKDVNNDSNSNLLLVNSIDKLIALILNIAIAVSFAIWYKKKSTDSTR